MRFYYHTYEGQNTAASAFVISKALISKMAFISSLFIFISEKKIIIGVEEGYSNSHTLASS